MNAAPPPELSGVRLSDAQKLDWLRLIRSESIGPQTFRALINRYNGAAAALDALPQLAAQRGKPIRVTTREEAEREMDTLRRIGARLVALGEPDYPASLRAIHAPPPVIAMRGEAAALGRPMVAFVGSRNASAAGLAFTERLVRDLAAAGFVIVSGLARGIDARAHRSSVGTGTIAVLAGGLDKIYPSEHAGLADEITERGALLSEMPAGWEPRGRDFPRRNRLVSGLALGVVVVEAAHRSGSLITARFANEQGREIFAVPGSPLDPRAAGANELLRQGATLCVKSQDILSVLEPMVAGGPSAGPLFREEERGEPAEPLWDELDALASGSTPQTQPGHEFDEPAGGAPRDFPAVAAPQSPARAGNAREKIEALLGPSPVPVDDLVRAAGVGVSDVQIALLELEMDGLLERHGGNLVSLTPR